MNLKEQLKKELYIIKKKWYIILFFIFSQYFHNCCTNLAYYFHVQKPLLFDVGFYYLPSKDLNFYEEIITNFILISTLCFSLLPFYYRNNKIYTTTIILRNMLTLSISVFLRSITFLSTRISSSSYHCRIDSEVYNPPNNLHDIFLRFDTSKGCGDMIFSGHENIMFIQILIIFYYGNKLDLSKKIMYILYFLYSLLLISASLIILICRNHYTVDVVISLYVTPLLFYFLLKKFPDYKIRKSNISLSSSINIYKI
jgi:hypothetical protein